MHRISVAAALVLALLLLPPAAARAGSYDVYTCVAAGKVWPNNAWSAAPASRTDTAELSQKTAHRALLFSAASIRIITPLDFGSSF